MVDDIDFLGKQVDEETSAEHVGPCYSCFRVEELEKLLWEDAMTDFASFLWQRRNWCQTLGRCVQEAGSLDQTSSERATAFQGTS